MEPEKRLNIRETAARLGVHPNTVRNWADRGLIRSVKIKGYTKFDLAEVQRFKSDPNNYPPE